MVSHCGTLLILTIVNSRFGISWYGIVGCGMVFKIEKKDNNKKNNNKNNDNNNNLN